MPNLTVLFQRSDPHAILPRRSTDGAAGYDLYLPEETLHGRVEYANAGWLTDAEFGDGGTVLIHPGDTLLFHLGFAVAVPAGYQMETRPRSGLAIKHGLTLANSPGTIDADYRGEVMVALHNTSRSSYTLRPGERIAQAIFSAVETVEFQTVDQLPPTIRGAGALGSTGTH